MNRDDVRNVLQSAARTILAEEAPVLTDEMELGEGTVDSLDVIEILMVVEDEHDIQLAAEDYNDLKTVGELVTMLESKLSNG